MTSVLAPANPSAAAVQRSQLFTCNSCQVGFRSSEQQRLHHRTDWHQYNLKRRITGLPPISSEIFAEKVHSAQASSRAEQAKAAFERKCEPCDRVYFSENAFQNHIQSGKHRQNVARAAGGVRLGDGDETESVISSIVSMGEPVGAENLVKSVEGIQLDTKKVEKENGDAKEKETEKGDEEAATTLPIEECLFCGTSSPSLMLNVKHMASSHGLFIPDADFLVDLEGLIRYLGKKLVLLNQCLFCDKLKGGLEGIRTHMRDKGHTMLGFDTEEQQIEIGQFYDFRSTYEGYEPEEEDEDDAPAGSKLKPKTPGENEGWEDADGQGEGEGWETDSSASSLDSLELCAVPIDSTHRERPERNRGHRMADGFHSHAHHHPVAYHDDFELHLPSGRSVGHRSLARYYKQNLRDHPQKNRTLRLADTPYPHREHADDEDVSSDDEEGGVSLGAAANRRERREQERLQLVSRGNGGLGMVGVTDAGKREVRKQEQKSRDQEYRGRRKYQQGVERQNNMQKHFRDPLLQ